MEKVKDEDDLDESSELPLTSSEGSDDEGRPRRGWRYGCAPPWAERVVQAHWFHVFIGVTIALNFVTIVVSTDHPYVFLPMDCIPCKDTLCFDLWRVCNRLFMIVFTVELILRLWVEGVCGFFCDSEGRMWNRTDFGIVAAGYFSAALSISSGVDWLTGCPEPSLGGSSRTILLARVLRFVRIVRVFRARSFPQLNLIVRGMVESLPQVATVLVLLLMLVFIVAILTTMLIGQQAETLWGEGDDCETTKCECGEDCENIKTYFGKVLPSMFTLFQFMTLDDWVWVSDLVSEEMPIVGVGLFYSFILVVGFVMLSLFSGVWVDHMEDTRMKVTKEQQLEAIQESEARNRTFQTIFGTTSSTLLARTKTIDEDDFATLLSRPELREAAAANDLKMSRPEAKELFAFWDVSHDERMTWKEFTTGLEEYREGLTVKKVLLMKSDLRRLARELDSDSGRLLAHVPAGSPEVAGQLARASARLRETENSIVRCEDQVKMAQRLCQPAVCSPLSVCSGGSP